RAQCRGGSSASIAPAGPPPPMQHCVCSVAASVGAAAWGAPRGCSGAGAAPPGGAAPASWGCMGTLRMVAAPVWVLERRSAPYHRPVRYRSTAESAWGGDAISKDVLQCLL